MNWELHKAGKTLVGCTRKDASSNNENPVQWSTTLDYDAAYFSLTSGRIIWIGLDDTWLSVTLCGYVDDDDISIELYHVAPPATYTKLWGWYHSWTLSYSGATLDRTCFVKMDKNEWLQFKTIGVIGTLYDFHVSVMGWV